MERKTLIITGEVLDRVVYGMENQKDRLRFNPADGLLHPETEDDGSFIPLPHWGSSEGYRLMDDFTATLPDTALRGRLLEILHSGDRVFRRFKDTLRDRPEIEALWRRYKQRAMKRAALSWLSRWAEAGSLESLGPEPEEWDDLVPSDFGFREAGSSDFGILEEWDRTAVEEAFPSMTPDEGGYTPLSNRDKAGFDEGYVIIAETPAGDPVGFTWVVFSGADRREGRLMQTYVLPDFRGLGIGSKLIAAVVSRAETAGVKSIHIRTGESGKVLENFLARMGFAPVTTLWRKTTPL